MVKSESRLRQITRIVFAVFYALVGYMHLAKPEGFLAITPGWVPAPETVIWLTGIAELAGAVGLMVPRSLIPWARPAAGIGFALYALCVWPANINHALYDIPLNGMHASWWYHGPRLAFQPVLIWVAFWVGGVLPLRAFFARKR